MPKTPKLAGASKKYGAKQAPTNFAILLDDGNTLDNFGKGKCGAKYSNLDLNGSLKLSVVKKMG